MASQPLPISSRPASVRSFPFRTASAGTSQMYLWDKLNSRPRVAAAPFATEERAGQDEQLSGMTRSLHYRVRGLNLPPALRTEN